MQVIVLFIAPSFLAAIIFNSFAVSALCYIGLYIIFLLFTVKEIRLTETGIEFGRIFGTPKYLAWGQISSIERASTREVILQGWLWPMFPAREMTPSLTSVGHYRIVYQGGYVYYPPRNAEEFEGLIPPEIKQRSNNSLQPTDYAGS